MFWKLFWPVAAVVATLVIVGTPFAHAMTSLEPFLIFEEMNGGTYQGIGWVKGKFLVGCHMIEDEGGSEECSVSSDFVNVRQKPNGRVIGALSNGVPILVMKRQGDWVEAETYCPDNLSTSSHDDVRVYSCEVRPK